jgi:ABC-type Fe3+ transport system substrate-binding protein
VKNFLVIAAAVLVVALPFVFRRPPEAGDWRPGDPVLVIVTPHNEAIRQEFAAAFSCWHERVHGRPVKVDWRVLGGTAEIMRYLASEYVAAAQAWWRRQGREWPAGGGERLLDRAFDPAKPPAEARSNETFRLRWEQGRELWLAFRGADTPSAVSCGLDLFFGGGTYDHEKAMRQGLTVPPWPGAGPVALLSADGPAAGVFADAAGREMIPQVRSGEIWRGDAFFGAVLSTFGICYNPDRLRDLGIGTPPASWRGLADPRLFGQVGVTDPTKSGSVAKAFEMIIQEQCQAAVRAAGFGPERVAAFEAAFRRARLAPGEVPTNVPSAYQEAIERGWVEGINLVRLIGANARYFTDAAGRVPIDVSAGSAAAGIAIDFYGRFQAETSRTPDGTPRLVYATPSGGSSVSADPISLLRGAPHRDLAVRFIAFVLGPEGQRLWNYRPGTPGGPRRFALRRLPIRRDFYPSGDAAVQAVCEGHRRYTSDDLTDPLVDPYRLAEAFEYQPRWTAAHFGLQRDLVRAMCLDAGEELRAAWGAIVVRGGPGANPAAMAVLRRLPDDPLPLTWRTAVCEYARADRMDVLRRWTAFFRSRYREARDAVARSGSAGPH